LISLQSPSIPQPLFNHLWLTMLDTKFNPAEIEVRLYKAWEGGGYFKPGRKPKAEPYTIVIPPPNVTGSLHMGHALNNTIQDILCRFERMRGRDVLWQPALPRRWWSSACSRQKIKRTARPWAAQHF
jgi:isoleucyl-tRNA synthetase